MVILKINLAFPHWFIKICGNNISDQISELI